MRLPPPPVIEWKCPPATEKEFAATLEKCDSSNMSSTLKSRGVKVSTTFLGVPEEKPSTPAKKPGSTEETTYNNSTCILRSSDSVENEEGIVSTEELSSDTKKEPEPTVDESSDKDYGASIQIPNDSRESANAISTEETSAKAATCQYSSTSDRKTTCRTKSTTSRSEKSQKTRTERKNATDEAESIDFITSLLDGTVCNDFNDFLYDTEDQNMCEGAYAIIQLIIQSLWDVFEPPSREPKSTATAKSIDSASVCSSADGFPLQNNTLEQDVISLSGSETSEEEFDDGDSIEERLSSIPTVTRKEESVEEREAPPLSACPGKPLVPSSSSPTRTISPSRGRSRSRSNKTSLCSIGEFISAQRKVKGRLSAEKQLLVEPSTKGRRGPRVFKLANLRRQRKEGCVTN